MATAVRCCALAAARRDRSAGSLLITPIPHGGGRVGVLRYCWTARSDPVAAGGPRFVHRPCRVRVVAPEGVRRRGSSRQRSLVSLVLARCAGIARSRGGIASIECWFRILFQVFLIDMDGPHASSATKPCLGPKVPLLMPTPTSSPAGSRTKKKRTTYDHAFKLKVVRAALERPPNNRIKPTCAWFPGIEPCQVNTH